MNLCTKSATKSPGRCRTAIRSDMLSFVNPVKKYEWNFFSKSAQFLTEPIGSDANQEKADPESDKGNR